MPKKKAASSKKVVKRVSRTRNDDNLGLNSIPQKISERVLHLRGEQVLLDSLLAELYGLPTGELNRAVKRNEKRFPSDFMFQLTSEEWENLKCQSGISSLELRSETSASNSNLGGHGGRRTAPYVFTEQGVAMLSSVLNSPRAIEVNIAIMRTFVQIRRLMSSNKLLEDKILKLEKKYDGQFKAVFDVIGKILRNELPE